MLIEPLRTHIRCIISVLPHTWWSSAVGWMKACLQQPLFCPRESTNCLIRGTIQTFWGIMDQVVGTSTSETPLLVFNNQCSNWCRFLILLVESWRIVIISGTVHWFWLKTSFHPLLWTSSGLTGSWKISAYIGFGSIRSVKSVKTRGNWKPKKC